MGYNRVTYEGHTTKDCELRSTPNGKSVASFSIAVGRNYPNQNGEFETDFFSVVVWGKLAEKCAKKYRKGAHLIVSGRNQVRSYNDSNDNKRYVTELIADTVQSMGKQQQSDTGASQSTTEGSMTNTEETFPF